MLIETTLHIHKRILDKLDKEVVRTGRSRTSIIKLLIQRVMKDNQKMIKINSRVKYQERDLKENWFRIHITLNEYEYEYYIDLRKLCKMSVSLILAYAVLKYMDELLDRNKSTDKYYFTNYLFIKKTYEGAICWQIYWGIPPQLIIS